MCLANNASSRDALLLRGGAGSHCDSVLNLNTAVEGARRHRRILTVRVNSHSIQRDTCGNQLRLNGLRTATRKSHIVARIAFLARIAMRDDPRVRRHFEI